MKTKQIVSIIILGLVYAVFVFCVAQTILLFLHIRNSDSYSQVSFVQDIETSLVIMLSSLLCNSVFIYYLLKKKIIKFPN
jgi:CHASE3 domain sensor protein